MPPRGKRKDNPGKADRLCPPLKTRAPVTGHPDPPTPSPYRPPQLRQEPPPPQTMCTWCFSHDHLQDVCPASHRSPTLTLAPQEPAAAPAPRRLICTWCLGTDHSDQHCPHADQPEPLDQADFEQRILSEVAFLVNDKLLETTPSDTTRRVSWSLTQILKFLQAPQPELDPRITDEAETYQRNLSELLTLWDGNEATIEELRSKSQLQADHHPTTGKIDPGAGGDPFTPTPPNQFRLNPDGTLTPNQHHRHTNTDDGTTTNQQRLHPDRTSTPRFVGLVAIRTHLRRGGYPDATPGPKREEAER